MSWDTPLSEVRLAILTSRTGGRRNTNSTARTRMTRRVHSNRALISFAMRSFRTEEGMGYEKRVEALRARGLFGLMFKINDASTREGI